jgi:nicotinamide-nucleotide amidase
MSVETKVISREINDLMWQQGATLSTAESCTAGNVAAAITSIPGSSQFYKGGVVGYSNEVKVNLLHVKPETLETYGAVSEETIIEMIKGVMKSLKTDYAVATSGVAGPGGGTPEKPVGTIWIAAGNADKIITQKLEGDEGREINVSRATHSVLQLLHDLLTNKDENKEE